MGLLDLVFWDRKDWTGLSLRDLVSVFQNALSPSDCTNEPKVDGFLGSCVRPEVLEKIVCSSNCIDKHARHKAGGK